MKLIAWGFLLVSASAFAGDPDLDYILKAVRDTPCSQVQVVIAPNLGSIRWEGPEGAWSLRYLFGEDIAPLRQAVVDSHKFPIDVDTPYELPNIEDPNWPAVEDALVADLQKRYADDRVAHPADHCDAPSMLKNGSPAVLFGGGFPQVTAGIYRGPRPSPQDLRTLASQGVKFVIDLEDDASAAAAERQVAAQLRLGWINEPMNAGVTPNDNEVSQILQMLQDPRRQPLLVHCKHGMDRSGLIIGLYRVLVQRWTPQQAYQEMLNMGFHPKYKALDNYFRAKTGYHGP